jgi:hypothetical protein
VALGGGGGAGEEGLGEYTCGDSERSDADSVSRSDGVSRNESCAAAAEDGLSLPS